MVKFSDQHDVEMANPAVDSSRTNSDNTDSEPAPVNQTDLEILLLRLSTLDFTDLNSIVNAENNKLTRPAFKFQKRAAGRNIDMSSHVILKYNKLLKIKQRDDIYNGSLVFPILAILFGIGYYFIATSIVSYICLTISIILTVASLLAWYSLIMMCCHPPE